MYLHVSLISRGHSKGKKNPSTPALKIALHKKMKFAPFVYFDKLAKTPLQPITHCHKISPQKKATSDHLSIIIM